MKSPKHIFLALALSLLASCTTGIVSMGKDTYMVARRGSTLSSKAGLEAKCLKDASQFCAQKKLVMIPISAIGRDGNPVPFGKGGSCDLVFKAVPPGSPQDVPTTMVRTTE